MNKQYRDATNTMEKAGVDPEYVLGWQNGYLGHPKREEQRTNDAYNAGYDDGKDKNEGNYASWAKKH